MLRLISEAARPNDVVALKVDIEETLTLSLPYPTLPLPLTLTLTLTKVDIEDHETVLLPCLASSRRLGSLVDVLYIEEHTNGPALAPAYAALRARGVSVETGWP